MEGKAAEPVGAGLPPPRIAEGSRMVVWAVTWGLWVAVVVLDYRREPRDARRLAPMAAVLALAVLTRDSMREFDVRLVSLCALACAVFVALATSKALARRRARRIESWAGEHGYDAISSSPRPARDLLPVGLRRLPFLGRGRSAQLAHLLRRVELDGTEVYVFDHAIRRPSAWFDPSGAEASGTVVAIRRPGRWLPMFQLRPVGLFKWMDGGPLGDSVSTSSVPAFAESYRLGGHEPRNLRKLFADDLLARMAKTPGWLIEGEGEWVAAFLYHRVEGALSLKPSTLRTVGLDALEDHAREAYRRLSEIADRGARPARDAGAA